MGGGRISQVAVCTVGSVCDSAGVVLRLFLLPEVCNVTKWQVSKNRPLLCTHVAIATVQTVSLVQFVSCY